MKNTACGKFAVSPAANLVKSYVPGGFEAPCGPYSPKPAGFSVLTGISASTSGGAWAVGGYNTDPANGTEHPDRTLTLQWSEGKWHAVPSPDPGDMGNYLYGVLDTRSGPVAVGEADSGTIPNLTVKPLMIRWNGSQWEPVTVPVPRP